MQHFKNVQYHNWEEVLNIKNGKSQKKVVNPNGNFPIYGSGGIMGYADDFLCQSGTTIIGRKGSINNPIYVNEKFWNVDTAFGLEPGENLDPKFLYYFCLTYNFLKHNKATTLPSLTKADLLKIRMPVPPLQTQQKIAEILDEADRLRQLDKQLIQKYEDLSQSLFLEMFGDTWNNPKNWDEYLIEDIASDQKHSIKAGPFGSALKKEFYISTGYKIYGQEQVIRDDFEYGDYYINEERFEKLKNCEIKSGDILISLVGTYGKISVVPDEFEKGIINPRLMKITPDKEIIRPIFLKILLQSIGVEIQLKNFSRGGTMDIVNVGIIRKVKIPLPPIELQDTFLKRRELIQKQIESIENNSLLSEELFNSLLQKAFKGELV